MESLIVLKIIGSVTVVASSALGGLYASSLDSFRIHDLNEMKKALSILKSEISFASAPLPEACKNIAAHTDKPVNKIFEFFSGLLDERRRESVSELWTESVEYCMTSTYYNKEDLSDLYAFGNTLGYLDKSMQMSAINIMIENIDGKVDLLSAAAEKNKRMYRSLGLLGGLLITVIFL